MVPQITNSNGLPTMLTPLSFVLIVSMVKDIIEDVKRHKFDKLENNKEVLMGGGKLPPVFSESGVKSSKLHLST